MPTYKTILSESEVRAIIAERVGAPIEAVTMWAADKPGGEVDITAEINDLRAMPDPASTVQHFHLSTGGGCPITVNATADRVVVNGREIAGVTR